MSRRSTRQFYSALLWKLSVPITPTRAFGGRFWSGLFGNCHTVVVTGDHVVIFLKPICTNVARCSGFASIMFEITLFTYVCAPFSGGYRVHARFARLFSAPPAPLVVTTPFTCQVRLPPTLCLPGARAATRHSRYQHEERRLDGFRRLLCDCVEGFTKA